jgi:hypothetical protein
MKKNWYFPVFFALFINAIFGWMLSLRENSSRFPAQSVSAQNRGWRLSFYDNFSTPAEAQLEAQDNELPYDSSCYTRDPRCEYIFWSKRTCEGWNDKHGSIYQNLKDLNKCKWTIYNKYNWMDFDIEEGKGVNSFHASQVVVKNGNLHLKANKNPEWIYKKSCKEKVYSGPYSNYSTDCPIISGGIESMPWGNHDEANDLWEFGFEQAYGRWEVRAKLPDGPGIWPGLWMLPMWSNPNPDPVQNTGGNVDCGWPHNGEFDLLETWSDKPHVAHQGLIQGNCGKDIDARKGFDTPGMNLVDEFHTYGMEWDTNYIKFYIDNQVTGTIWKGDKLRSKHRSGPNEGEKARPKERAWIHSYPFFWILNLSIEGKKSDPKLRPNYDTWTEKEVVIDYVKVFRRCSQAEFEADALRPVHKKLCHHFQTDANPADAYQSTRNETASASMTAYPNPYKMGNGPITVEFRLHQNCQDVKIDLVNTIGQIVQAGQVNFTAQNSSITPKQHYLHDGPLQGDFSDPNQIYVFTFTPSPSLASGMYFIRAEYQKCDSGGGTFGGKGNYVWKQVILK